MGLEAEITRLSQELGEALLAKGWLAHCAGETPLPGF